MCDMTETSAPEQLNKADHDFILVIRSRAPGCPHCTGLMEVQVETTDHIIGTLRSDYPWHMEINPDDPSTHPDTPHYQVDWSAYDVHGTYVPIVADSTHFMAVDLVKRAMHGSIDTLPAPKRKKK